MSTALDTNERPERPKRPETALQVLIKGAMARHGWKGDQAAQACDVPKSTFNSYTKGRAMGVSPRARRTLAKLSEGLGIPLAALEDAAGMSTPRTDLDKGIDILQRLEGEDRHVAVTMLEAMMSAQRTRTGH